MKENKYWEEKKSGEKMYHLTLLSNRPKSLTEEQTFKLIAHFY